MCLSSFCIITHPPAGSRQLYEAATGSASRPYRRRGGRLFALKSSGGNFVPATKKNRSSGRLESGLTNVEKFSAVDSLSVPQPNRGLMSANRFLAAFFFYSTLTVVASAGQPELHTVVELDEVSNAVTATPDGTVFVGFPRVTGCTGP